MLRAPVSKNCSSQGCVVYVCTGCFSALLPYLLHLATPASFYGLMSKASFSPDFCGRLQNAPPKHLGPDPCNLEMFPQGQREPCQRDKGSEDGEMILGYPGGPHTPLPVAPYRGRPR